MAISFQCTVCNKPYKAKDQMAGKRVRCKQCGAVIDIPVPADGLDPSIDFSALAGAELAGSSGEMEAIPGPTEPTMAREIAPGKTRMERPEEAPPMFELAGSGDSAQAVRPNRPFSFPYADMLDQWVPRVLVWGGMLWVLLQTLKSDTTDSWLAWVRAGVALLIFACVVVPICAYGVGQAAKSQRFALPAQATWRSAAIFSVPFVLGYVLWIVGQAVPNLVSGLVIGLILACFFMWLLLRLELKEIGPTCALASVGFAVSIVAAAVVMFGLNWVLLTILTSHGTAGELPGSPIGFAFNWVAPDSAPKTSTATPSVASGQPRDPAQGGGPVPPRPPVNTQASGQPRPPADVPADSQWQWGPLSQAAADRPRIADVTVVGEIGGADEVLRPLAPLGGGSSAPWVAMVRYPAPKEDRVECWSVGSSPQRGGEAIFAHAAGIRDRYHLSTRGDQVARMINWPRSVEIWSYAAERSRAIPLVPDSDLSLELLGFCAGDRLLVYGERRDNQRFVYVIDSTSGELVRSLDLAPNRRPDRFERWPGNLAVSPDGRWLAVLSGDDQNWTELVLHNLALSSEQPRRLPVQGVRWPVRARGLAFSPDGRLVAALMENEGNALIVCGDIVKRTVFQHIKAGGLFPTEARLPAAEVRSPGNGDSRSSASHRGDPRGDTRGGGEALGGAYRCFDFLADGSAWLIDADGIFDVETGAPLGRLTDGQLKLSNVRFQGQCVVDPTTVAIVVQTPAGQKRVAVAKLLKTPEQLREQLKTKKQP